MLDIKQAIRSEIRGTIRAYVFICSVCNTEIYSQKSQLKRHTGKCRKCTQLGIPYKHIYNELKNHKNKKHDVLLTFEEFLKIIEPSKCHYCEDVLTYNQHTKVEGKIVSRAYQLDRKNNLEGYTFTNLVPCCWECNRLKSDIYAYEEFLIIAEGLRLVKLNRRKIS